MGGNGDSQKTHRDEGRGTSTYFPDWALRPMVLARYDRGWMIFRYFHLRARNLLVFFGVVFVLWLALAYLLLPDWWQHRDRQHPALSGAPTLTSSPAGLPGDPLNLFIIASESELTAALLKTGWYPADPVTLGTSLRITEDAILRRPYTEAPVSDLLLFGRRQDLAFEKPFGHDPRERHHVRFWLAPRQDSQGRAAWWGAATFDTSVGLSHTTGEITHHISSNVDAERDLFLQDLKTGGFTSISYRPDFQKFAGKNGGGDPWTSDGRLGTASR